MKKIITGIVILLGCILFLIYVSVQFFQTGYVQRIIQKKINAAIPGQLKWKHLRLSLMRGEIEVHQIYLLGSSADEIAAIDRLFIDIDWLPLLSREIVIDQFNAKHPRVSIRLEKDGTLNLVGAFSSGPAKEEQPDIPPESGRIILPFNIVVESANITDGAVTFSSYDKRTDINIHHIELAAEGDLYREKAKATLAAKSNHVRITNFETGIEQIHLSAAYQKDQIPRLDLTVQTPETTVILTGEATDLFKTPDVDMKLDLKCALSEINTIFNLKPNVLSGLADVHLNISGALDNPEATLKLDYKDGVLFSQPVEKIQMALDLKDRIATFNDLSVYAVSGESRIIGSVDLQSAFPHGFFDSTPKMDHLSYALHLTQQGIHLNQLTDVFKTVSGELSSRIDISGKGILPENLSAKVNLEITAKNLSTKEIPKIPPVRIIGDVVFHQNELALNRLNLISEDTNLNAVGKLDLSEKMMTATVELNSPDIHPLASIWGMGNSRGSIMLNAQLDGPIKSPKANITIIGRGLLTGDIILGDLETTVRLDRKGILDISKLYVKNQNGILDGQGRIEIFKESTPLGMSMPLAFSMDFQHIDPKSFYKGSPVAGELNGQFTIGGKMNQPVASLKLDGKAVQIQSVALGDITSDLRFSKGRLYINRTEVMLKNSVLKLSGDVQLLEDHSFKPVKAPFFQADIESDKIFLQDILYNDNAQGNFSLKAQIKGRPEDVQGNIRLQGSDITLYKQKIESLNLNADLMGDKIQIQPLVIFLSPKESIHLTGWVARDKTYDFALTADDVDFKKIQSLQENADFTDGKLSVHMKGQGTFDAPQISGDIQLTHIQINQKTIKDVFLAFGLENNIIRVSGDVHCDVDGMYDLSDKRFSLKAQFPNTDLSPYFMLLDQPDISGHLLGKIEISGTGNSLGTYAGELDISELMMRYKNEPLIQGRDLNVLLKDQEITTRDFSLLFLDNGRLNINSQIKADETISIVIDGQIPLSVVNVFQKDLPEITGDLWIIADIQGAMSSPRMQAEVTVKNLQTMVPYLNQTLHDTEALIRITPQKIDIGMIKGQLDSGSFEMTGQIDLDQQKPVSALAQLKIRQMPINIPDTMDLTFNSDIRFQGKPEKSTIEGDLTLLEGLYYKDVDLLPLRSIGQKKRKSDVSSHPIQLPFLENMELNLTVKHRQPMAVDNNIARMDIVPSLNIRGTLNHPVINGRMAVQSGEVMYQKKTFAIEKGIIDFINPYETEPTVDIRAGNQIRNWRGFLNISGKPDQLEFKLSSEPVLDDADILSLLVLGKTSEELRKGEGGSNLSAAQMLSQFMASTFNEDVKNVTGLDIFEAESSEQENKNRSNGVKVTLGKELTKRITVKYSVQNENGEIVQQAIAEYKLLEEVLLSIFQGNKGAFGGSAKYRLEFR